MDVRRNLAFDCSVREIDGAARKLTFVASTERVARDGDIIKVDGWDTAEYERNPVFLWAHDPSVPPIGRVTGIRKVTKGEPRLEADVEFSGSEDGHDLAETVYRLYRRGFLKAVSVGFRIRGHEVPDEEKREQYGLPPGGWIITKAELLEISAVPVPADPGALQVGAEDRAALVRVRSVTTSSTNLAALDALLVEEVRTDPALSVTTTLNPNLFKHFHETGDRLDRIEAQIRELRDDLVFRGAVRHAAEPEAPPRDEDESDDLYRFSDWLDAKLRQRKDPSNG